MDLNPAHVRSFAAVVRHGGFSRAAVALSLSQSAVSLHVRALEERLGLRVLDRAARRIRPTRAGAVLLDHAGRAFAELAGAERALRALSGVVTGRVRIGTGATASIHLLPPILGALRRRHPELELVLVTGNSVELAAAVAAGELDLGVLTLPLAQRRLEVTPFFTDRLVAIGPAARGARLPRALTPARLARPPFIAYERGGTFRQIVDDWFRRGGAAPRVSMELGDIEAIKRLVAAGLGWSVTSAVAVAAERRAGTLRVRPLVPALSRRLVVVRRRDAARAAAAGVVLAALEAASRRAQVP